MLVLTSLQITFRGVGRVVFVNTAFLRLRSMYQKQKQIVAHCFTFQMHINTNYFVLVNEFSV